MKLEDSNIVEWKKKLDEAMMNAYGIEEYSKTMTDDEWLDEFIGFTPEETIESLDEQLN